jgi:CheY-like chemotaxis protein
VTVRLWKGDRQLRVLVVLQSMLEALGYIRTIEFYGGIVVGFASRPSGALEAAVKRLPDVALIDTSLWDGTDGTDAASLLRAAFNTPIVFCSNEDPQDDDRVADLAGAQLLIKPILDADLTSALLTACAQKGDPKIPDDVREFAKGAPIADLIADEQAKIRKALADLEMFKAGLSGSERQRLEEIEQDLRRALFESGGGSG